VNPLSGLNREYQSVYEAVFKYIVATSGLNPEIGI
jgi:hypothetical protein